MAADQPTPRPPVVLTRDGRAWIEDRLARMRERLVDIDEDLAHERTEELVTDRERVREQLEELEVLLRDAVSPADVIDDPSIVELGDEVEVEFEDGEREAFLVVHPVEAGMDEHRTSSDAPLAKAVLGARPGDTVTVRSPAGDYTCTIVRRDRIG
ncbi:MAG: GreA/GreB family elongation factor [Nitriliruptoraceae bacterium]